MAPSETTVDQGEQALGSALRLAIGRLSRQLRRHAAGGLTPGEHSALATVERTGPTRPSELADLEGVSAPTLSRIVARLERRGYLVRAGDPDDGRSSLLTVSPAGRRALAAVRAERTAVLARALEAIDPGEREALAAALPALGRLLDELREG